MPTPDLHPDLLSRLRTVDTPTLCNALHQVMGGGTVHGFTYATVVAPPQALRPMVGWVRTARMRARTASSRPADEMRRLRLDYYRYVAVSEGRPTIVVMQDLDERPGTGAFWDEVDCAVHEGLGVAGVLTNGSVRDIATLRPTFPVLAGSIGPARAFAHVQDFGEPVQVFGLALRHDDLLHADRHGAVRIPPEHLAALPEAFDLVRRRQMPLLQAARSPGFDIAALEQALGEASDVV